MTLSECVSFLALAISLASLLISVYVAMRDTVRLKLTARYYPADEHGEACIQLSVTNHGRRPAILRTLGGELKNGGSVGKFLGESATGLRLGEHERFDKTLSYNDVIHQDLDTEDEYKNLRVEDSLGVHHYFKGSEKMVRQLLGHEK